MREAARASGVPPELADAVATVESGYNPAAAGADGEVGLMQVLPSTARLLGFSGPLAELAQPETNIRYGVAYLAGAWRLAGGDICTAVMKYRAGHAESRFSHRSVEYCRRVRAHLARLGYPVTGPLPEPAFGAPVTARAAMRASGRSAARRQARSRYDWRAADARMQAIASRISASMLVIAR
ncbi:transglycosylase SLT domain-containing protein [Camelimonas abortus]|uniref:Transglycosylase SLT domain-containing protein n=1 Tax=Camelimonas abortus TaxID=1017184 RepID=A0ABV7LCK3_9HYPH